MYVRSSYKPKAHENVRYDKIKLFVVWQRGETENPLHEYLRRFEKLLGDSKNVCLTKAVYYTQDEADYVFGPAALDEIASNIYEGFALEDMPAEKAVVEIAINFVPRDSPAVGYLVMKHHEARKKCRCSKVEPMLELIDRVGPLGFEKI